MYAEVEEYFRHAARAERAYRHAVADAEHAYQKAWREAEWAAEDAGRRFDRYSDPDAQTVREIRQTRDAAYEAAQDARDNDPGGNRNLLLQSEHLEVRWIAENCLFNNQGSEVEGHAKTILKALPATPEELWALAKNEHDMCNTFDRFFDQAEAAGVFNNGKVRAGWRETAALRNYLRRSYGGSYVQPLMERVDPILKAIREDYERRLEEAKAEWMQMDAARAEQVHRNRSEGARRAAATRRAAREEGEAKADKEPMSPAQAFDAITSAV